MALKSMLNICHCPQAEEFTAALLFCRDTHTTISGRHLPTAWFYCDIAISCGSTLQVTNFFANRSNYLPEALPSLSQHPGSLTTGFLAHLLS